MSRRFELRESPHTVLEDIFRSIGFHDRLRCEQACKDWRDLIHTEMAFRKVTVRLVHGRNPSVLLYRGMAPDQNPRPWLADQTWSGIQTPDDLLLVVPVTKFSPDVPSAAHSFVAWLFRRAAGLDELNVALPDLHCQLPCQLQLFDHLATGLLLQAHANFHGTLGTSGFEVQYHALYDICSMSTATCVLVQETTY